MTTQQKIRAIEELNTRIHADMSLPLREIATNTVPGEGNVDADILFVGEAPGQKEDELGRPFVGAAGKLLDQLIESIGLKRENVFIANLIKHRPPGNRDPVPEEIAAYTPYLDEQLKIIEPKLIVTLGRYSMAYFLGPGLVISKIHGQPKRNAKGQVVMPMYHPAAALYSGNLRPALFADFAKIPKVLEMVKKGKAVNKEDKGPVKAFETQKRLL
jgi:uracil-DNA glycosylase